MVCNDTDLNLVSFSALLTKDSLLIARIYRHSTRALSFTCFEHPNRLSNFHYTFYGKILHRYEGNILGNVTKITLICCKFSFVLHSIQKCDRSNSSDNGNAPLYLMTLLRCLRLLLATFSLPAGEIYSLNMTKKCCTSIHDFKYLWAIPSIFISHTSRSHAPFEVDSNWRDLKSTLDQFLRHLVECFARLQKTLNGLTELTIMAANVRLISKELDPL